MTHAAGDRGLPPESGSRGRIVMLVDNAVRNDSRVRKQARSAADLGWDVVLIGRAPGREPERFLLGGARVRLLPVPPVLGRRRYELRSPLTRGSVGYSSLQLARYRQRQVEARLHDVRGRRMALKQESAEPDLRHRVNLGLTKLGLARGLAAERWVSLRARATERDAAGESPLAPTRPWITGIIERTLGPSAWRVFDPHLWDFEFAYKDAVDRLEPDIVHANDFAMIGVGARAVVRARARGRRVRLVYDAHEYVPGMSHSTMHPWWLPAQVANEREYIHRADAVVTVSDTLAEMLQDTHGLPERPTVVLNAPPVGEATPDPDAPRMRELCGIGADTPLLVYSGSMTPQRGVQIMVEALPRLPGVHVAFVISTPRKPFVQELLERASALGVRDRVHLLPYVDPEHVVDYVAAADVGVHPTHHHLNHEISLATKFFEYSHARLPIVVSDVRTMSEMVRRSGQGEVFRAEDVDDYVRAVRAVLADPGRYRSAYDRPGLLEEWTWEKQAEILDGVYDKLIRQ